MKKHFIFLKLLHIFSFFFHCIALLWVRYKYPLNSSFCLPYWKAQFTPSPSLPKARNSLLWRHPWTPRIWGKLNFRSIRVKQSGFTLLEIIVTLVISAVLGTMIVQYFGTNIAQSPVPVNRLQAASSFEQVMENITADFNVGAIWQASTAYALDTYVAPTTKNGYFYKCSQAGTTGGTEQDWTDSGWPTDAGGNKLITDSGVIWTETPILTALKEKIGTAGAAQNNGYGIYTVVENDFIKFVSVSGNWQEASLTGGDPEDTLKVSIQNDSGETLTTLFTSS